MRWPVPLVVAFALAPSVGHAQPESDEAAIRRIRVESNRAIARHDVDAIIASMEEDVHVAASTGAVFSGRDAMGAAFAARFAENEDAVYVRTTETVELSSSGPFAAEVGVWAGGWSTAEGPFRTGGRFVAYWRKTDGVWRIHAELYVPLYCEGVGCGAPGADRGAG